MLYSLTEWLTLELHSSSFLVSVVLDVLSFISFYCALSSYKSENLILNTRSAIWQIT
jgi:hypothetical protein